jgi:hypothetical protein
MSKGMWNRGKLVIVFILAVALGAAGFSLWHHYRGQHQSLDFWGASTAVLIAEAPHVEVLQLGAARPLDTQEDSDPLGGAADDGKPPEAAVAFGDSAWSVEASHEAIEARGATNLRRALVLDTTFDWHTPSTAPTPKWQYALEVNNGRLWATVLFDFDSHCVALAGGKKTALLDPAANEDFRAFFTEQFPPEPVEKEE